MKYHEMDQAMQKCRNWKVMPANCLAPIRKWAYKKKQQQNKEEAFQDGDSTGKTRHCLSSYIYFELEKLCDLFAMIW